MSHSVRIGRVWNIPIGFHRSWVIIFALVTLSLAIGYMPAAYPDFAMPQYWLLAFITSILFFVSVLVHELAHAWMALRFDMPVRQITLLLFGGVAELEKEPPSAKAEFWVAVAGPVASFMLAALFFGISTFGSEVMGLATVATYLFQVNVALAVFNLLPGFPLDGGRILRAALWHFTNYRTGTVAAASMGQIFAYGLMGIGAIQLFTGDIFNGLWLALIGLFLNSSASSHRKQVATQSALEDAAVAHVMERQWHEVKGNMPVSTLLEEKVAVGGPSFYFVRRPNMFGSPNPHGLITLSDISALRREQWGFTPVERLMTNWNQLSTTDPSDSLNDALSKMESQGVSQLPVVEDGAMVGVLSRSGVMSYINNH